ncbi:helix-turn-helix domain-containing protein [Chitinivorax tropicus]|uniref:helix-turn-helix domain-containing protein n=1 Tax=Chitinivorax tropicus TaxID=714531 RepID=UPI001618E651
MPHMPLCQDACRHDDNLSEVARRLGISRNTLYRRLSTSGLSRRLEKRCSAPTCIR